ncbi:uncharacterized protein LOC119287463 [Triticum dicoccoides]|uniref:uncharacterized protein LOC119287463 n=1 Tax=Triticum dicoccoides TaxID=85692 RepID=UPI00188EFEC0|nr:uncharacterized protein LOC119287463 [Triticum dicoccoides]
MRPLAQMASSVLASPAPLPPPLSSRQPRARPAVATAATLVRHRVGAAPSGPAPPSFHFSWENTEANGAAEARELSRKGGEAAEAPRVPSRYLFLFPTQTRDTAVCATGNKTPGLDGFLHVGLPGTSPSRTRQPPPSHVPSSCRRRCSAVSCCLGAAACCRVVAAPAGPSLAGYVFDAILADFCYEI